MYQYISLLLILWLTLVSKVRNGSVEEKNPSPLILSPLISPFEQDIYRLPIKARPWPYTQEFYHSEKKDGHFFCPREVIHEPWESYYQNCLVESKFEENEEKRCRSEVKHVLVERRKKPDSIGEEEEVKCGSAWAGILYAAVFRVCQRPPNYYYRVENTLENITVHWLIYYSTPSIYEVCYDHLQNRVLFAKHRILTPDILRKAKMEDERARHEFPQQYSTDGYGIANLNNLEKMADAFKQRVPENSEDKLVLQMLVPTDDFALSHLKKTTFHIINYALLHQSKVAVWNAINSYVRSWVIKQRFDEASNPLIFTGTSGHVGENKDIIIPKLWWKALYSTTQEKGVVIIMHNYNDPKKICDVEVTACQVTKWRTGQLKKEDFQYVYCCSLSSASRSIHDLRFSDIYLEFGVMKLV